MKQNNTSRNILIHLACVHNGDWQAISAAIRRRDTDIPEKDLETASRIDAVTYLDDDYPAALKNAPQPPFVLFRSDYRTDPIGFTDEYRLTSGFQADAYIQRVRYGSWDYNEREAQQEVEHRFDESPTIAVTDQAEIEIRNGNKVGVYREWYSSMGKASFAGAYRIASALSKDLFVFHAKKAGGSASVMIATHTCLGGQRNVYVLPHQWAAADDACNDYIFYGAIPLTRQTLADAGQGAR